MDLLKYLEPMKNLSDRFSNLAFWRGVRKLRDEVVNAFEYVDSWGESIEHTLNNVKNVDYTQTKQIKCNFNKEALTASFYGLSNRCVVVRGVYGITVPNLPPDFGSIAYGSCDISTVIDGSQLVSPCQALVFLYNDNGTVKMNLNNFTTYFGDLDKPALPIDTTFYVDNVYLYYYPAK